MEQENFIKTHAHSLKRVTETLAVVKAAKKAQSLKCQIYDSIVNSETYGLTPDEWCDAHNALINTVRRRFTDLWKEGKIKRNPYLTARLNNNGNNCTVWIAGRDENL